MFKCFMFGTCQKQISGLVVFPDNKDQHVIQKDAKLFVRIIMKEAFVYLCYSSAVVAVRKELHY